MLERKWEIVGKMRDKGGGGEGKGGRGHTIDTAISLTPIPKT